MAKHAKHTLNTQTNNLKDFETDSTSQDHISTNNEDDYKENVKDFNDKTNTDSLKHSTNKQPKHSDIDKVKKNKHVDVEKIDEIELENEVYELEYNEDNVVYYIVDENDNEIGICILEDGEEIEYIYEDNPEKYTESNLDPENIKKNINNVKNELHEVKDDVVDVARELKQTSEEIHKIYEDVKEKFKIKKII